MPRLQPLLNLGHGQLHQERFGAGRRVVLLRHLVPRQPNLHGAAAGQRARHGARRPPRQPRVGSLLGGPPGEPHLVPFPLRVREVVALVGVQLGVWGGVG